MPRSNRSMLRDRAPFVPSYRSAPPQTSKETIKPLAAVPNLSAAVAANSQIRRT
jgi:hypothetical protein